MSKLWIVHRHVRLRAALARLSGVAAEHRVDGAPTDDVFATASAPAAILIGFEGDFERELDFLHRHADRLRETHRRLLAAPEDAAEVMRLTGAGADELIDGRPDPRALRDFVVHAVAHRAAEPLAARRERERLADRFAHWFGELEIPGLLRTLDPALARLPLLVRGVSGSGRGLAARYVERFRRHDANGVQLRVDPSEPDPIRALETRLAAAPRARTTTIWLDDVDGFPVAAQRVLGDWIRVGPPAGLAPGTLRWIATAQPETAGGRGVLEPGLAAALSALTIELPSLANDPEATADFARRLVADWSARFGGPERRLDDDAFAVLETIAWVGDRVAVEGALHAALVRHGEPTLTAAHLEGGSAATLARAGAADSVPADDASEDRAAPPSPAVLFDEAPVIPPPEPAAPPGTPGPAADDSLTPSAATAELERAFAEGGLESAPTDAAEAGRAPTDAAPEEDPSRAMSDEAFGRLDPPAAAPPTPAAPAASATSSSPSSTPPADAPSWRRLARSLSHEIRNPLVSIRTFTQLLPDHFEDDQFRERFTDLVGRDIDHIDAVIDRLARAAEREKVETEAIDVSALIESLLDARRSEIGERRLLVLRELERDAPVALADAQGIEIALAGLLDRALAALPERGDLFVATRRIERGPDGAPRLRVLLRHHNPELAGVSRDTVADATLAANAIEYVLAETIVQASGGQLTIDATDAQETLILVDLRTPGDRPG